VDSVRIRNAGERWTPWWGNGVWQGETQAITWLLPRGTGKKTVYVQYRDAAGNVSATASDSIIYRP
jgi:hypothetical protein